LSTFHQSRDIDEIHSKKLVEKYTGLRNLSELKTEISAEEAEKLIKIILQSWRGKPFSILLGHLNNFQKQKKKEAGVHPYTGHC
jgi:hypothetical protein